jgi:hypothetical protein
MHKIPCEVCWYEIGDADRSSPSPEELIDVANAEAVLDFTNRYLLARSRPASDDEIHHVTASIGRYKGPQLVGWATLESFLAGILR